MKVSVLLITYNQEDYIAQTLDSILMQETEYDYEIVIGEDCSTDNTRNILLDYKKNNPDKIRLILAEKNRGLVANFANTYKSCSGEYIAMIDGDDYWTSPRKLQMQVDFLDSHKDFAMCFHPVNMVFLDGEMPNRIWPTNIVESYTQKDILHSNFIPSCTVMLRNGLVEELPNWYYSLKTEDWSLYVLLTQHGKIGFLNEAMAVYRVHSRGVWSSQEDIVKLLDDIKFYDCMKLHFGKKYRNIIRGRLDEYYYKLALLYEDKYKYDIAKKYAQKCLFINPLLSSTKLTSKVKMAIRLYFPLLYRFIKANNLKFGKQ